MNNRAMAFTLIEALASAALAALLMVAVLNVSQSTARRDRVMEAVEREPAWIDRAFEQIAWDLQHARSIAVQDGQLSLAGYGSLDTNSYVPTHRPVQIEYQLRNDVLIRSQTELDSITTSSTHETMLGTGISRFEPQSPKSNKVTEKQTEQAGTPAQTTDTDQDQSQEAIAWIAPSPDPMSKMPGLKPLNPYDTLEIAITLGGDDNTETYRRTLIVGAAL